MSDLIDRQALIGSLYESFVDAQEWKFKADDAETKVRADSAVATFIEAILRVKAQPSAQPEIIRCKDCKWYGRVDKRRFYRGMDCMQKRIDTIVPDRDFCSRAERRTDE